MDGCLHCNLEQSKLNWGTLNHKLKLLCCEHSIQDKYQGQCNSLLEHQQNKIDASMSTALHHMIGKQQLNFPISRLFCVFGGGFREAGG